MSGYASTFQRAFRSTFCPGPFSTGPFVIDGMSFNPLPEGTIQASEGGAYTSHLISIMPWTDAPQGTYFSMRLLYWNHRGDNLDDASWVGVPLMEVLCRVSNVAGNTPGKHLASSQRVCDQIVLANGGLGIDGAIYSFGAGSDVPAMVTCEVQGARLLSFDFQVSDENGQATGAQANMNAYWAKSC